MDGMATLSCYNNCTNGVGWRRKIKSATTVGACTSQHKQLCHKRSRKLGSSKLSSCLLIGLVFLYTVQPSSQYLEFISEPAPYYYTRPGDVTVIPCQAVEIGPSGTETPVSTLPYVNQTPVDIYRRPQNLQITLKDGLVSGMLVSPTLKSDSGSVYSCRVESGDLVLLSLNSTLFVGDGEPLAPVEAPCYMTDTDLSSLTVFWGYAPVPSGAPLLGYTIKYRSSDSQSPIEVVTNDNDTSIRLTSLEPGTNYTVVVQGRNSYGPGELSEPIIVTTMKGAVPSPPTQVNADVKSADGSDIKVDVSWMAVAVEPEIMTPVRDYLIYHSDVADGPVLIATVSNTTLRHTLTLKTSASQKYMFGVAARNIAGLSDIAFSDEIYINVSASRLVVSSPVIGAIVAASILLVLASIIIFCIIVCIRTRMRSLDALQLSSIGSNSPDSRKKETYAGNDSREESKNMTVSTDCSLNYSCNVVITVEEDREQIQMQTLNAINSRELDHLQAELERKS